MSNFDANLFHAKSNQINDGMILESFKLSGCFVYMLSFFVPIIVYN